MSKCVKCTSPIGENAKFCPICGAEQPFTGMKNNFCANCGTAIARGSNFCQKCGTRINSEETATAFRNDMPAIIRSLINRVTASSVLWLVVGNVQVLLAIINLIAGSVTRGTLWTLILGIANIVMSIIALAKKGRLRTNYSGIVSSYAKRVTFSTVFLYIWNGVIIVINLIFGGLLGVLFAILSIAAILVDAIAVQGFVKKNRDAFASLEIAQTGKVVPEEDDESNKPEPDLNPASKWDSILRDEEIQPIDEDQRLFRLYMGYTKVQLIELLDSAEKYEPEAVAIAKYVYYKRFIQE